MGTEIVNWEEKLAREAKEVAATERPSVSGISLRGGIMMLNDVPVPGNRLNCVVIASAFENAYYSKPYDPNNIVNPDCFALSLDGEGMAPIHVPEPVNPICVTCGNMAWGSDKSKPNSKGKACKEKRRLAILPASAVKDGEIMKAEMATMTLSVTNVRHWGNYVNQIAAEFGRPPWAMLTEIVVSPHVKNQFEVKYAAMGVVNDQYLGDLEKRAILAREVLMTPYDPPAPQVERQAPEAAGKKKY